MSIEDDFSVVISRRYPDQGSGLLPASGSCLRPCRGRLSELTRARRLPNGSLISPACLNLRGARRAHLDILLANLRPEALPVLITAAVRILEVLMVISIGAARWILLQAIDDRLRNGRLICRQVHGKVGIAM